MTPAHIAVGRAMVATPQLESFVPSVLHSINVTAGTVESHREQQHPTTMQLSTTYVTSEAAITPTIPNQRGKPSKTGGALPPGLCLEYIQHMRAPTPPHHVRQTLSPHDRP
jgi:hypothetical protein